MALTKEEVLKIAKLSKLSFEEKEIEAAIEGGAKPITLGRRILRTETAGLAILSVLMFQLEN